jgi:trimeric autotransporter adhesin
VALAMMGMLLMSKSTHATTTFTVNSASDLQDINLADGVCDADFAIGNLCTLRAAIQHANATTGADVINFSIGSGLQTKTPSSALPPITDQVTIDGYTQPDSSVNTLAKGTNAKLTIKLDGTGAGSGTDGLAIQAKDTAVKGLVINDFGARGIVFLGASDADGAKIEGNFIGTNPAGTVAEGNREGLNMTANSNVTVGGTSLATRNLISGNQVSGVAIFGQDIGTNNVVRGNLIGTDKNATGDLGNGDNGVAMFRAVNDTLEANTIAFNGSVGAVRGKDGVTIFDGNTGTRILSNSIFANEGLGIDLVGPGENFTTDVSTPNDLGDADSGANNLQNKPSLGSAKTISGKTTIKGQLNSSPGNTYTIQFFSNPSGTNEGKSFIGQKKGLTVDGSGKGSFTFSPVSKVAVGQAITATATNDDSGDTSEFSAPKKVASS